VAVLAVAFDFDDTLVPDSTTKLLKSRGVDPVRFWQTDVPARITQGWDPTLAWLAELLENVQPGRPLEGLTNAQLREFGATLDADFYQGLPGLFDDLRTEVSKYRDLSIEFYIVSGGLKDVIDGSRTVQLYFAATYGSLLAEDPKTRAVGFIKRAVTFTEKTRFLFEIHKGIEPAETIKNPYLVNQDVPKEKRRIPFGNMVYIGDGLTDIPCFSLLKQAGGIPFGVFDPTKQDSAKRAFREFLKTGRVVNINTPRYGPDDDLGVVLRAVVAARATELSARRAEA